MARITVEDCLKQTGNRFSMTRLACKRARKLAVSGIRPLLPWENDKPTVMALREIAAGHIKTDEDIDKERAPDAGSIAALEAEAEQAAKKALLAEPSAETEENDGEETQLESTAEENTAEEDAPETTAEDVTTPKRDEENT